MLNTSEPRARLRPTAVAALFGFLLLGLVVLLAATIGILIAAALRSVTVLTTFAWIGLAFIAANHVMWLVFHLILVSIWPLKPWTYVSGGK